jgi:Zn-dependent peptidase ImmA (M78 family)
MGGFGNFHFKYNTEKAARTALSLVDYYNLHHNPFETVNTSPLLDKFDLRFLELPDTTCGFTLDVDHKIIIALNNELGTEMTRYVAMHEVGHVACWHPNQLNSCVAGQFMYDQLETEATAVAAYLLVPVVAVQSPVHHILGELAKHYCVPEELVKIRRSLFLRHRF